MLTRLPERLRQFVDRIHKLQTDTRTFAGRFDDQRRRHCDLLTIGPDLTAGGWNALRHKAFLGGGLIHGHPAGLDAAAGVGEATPGQQLLNATVLAEGSVQADERQVGTSRHREILVVDHHLLDLITQGPKGLRDRGAGPQGDLTFGGGPRLSGPRFCEFPES